MSVTTVTSVAPTNEEVQEANPPTEQPIEQPSTATSNVSVSRGISILSMIYTWQPCGIRVIVDLPVVTNNIDPLFVIRANPLIAHPKWISAACGYELSKNSPAVFQPNNTSTGISIVYYGAPTLLAALALTYRKWKGGLKFMMRSTATFTNPGNLAVSPLFGAFESHRANAMQLVPSKISPTLLIGAKKVYFGNCNMSSALSNSMAFLDMSNERHLEVEVPYRYPTKWFDQFLWYNNMLNPQSYAVETELVELSSNITNFAGVFNLNQINGSTSIGTNQIIYELFVCASSDFTFADPRSLPNSLFTTSYATNKESEIVVFPNSAYTDVTGSADYVDGPPPT